jgi:hypothetical protein
MPRKPISTFSLSFLDCLCCGFGSVILVFMLISSRVTTESQEILGDLRAQALRLSVQTETLGEEVAEENEKLVGLRSKLEKKRAAARSKTHQVEQLDRLIALKRSSVSSSKEDVTEALAASAKPASQTPETREKRGQRELVTGLNMSGDHILILLDVSASMLDRYIANVLLVRNLSPARQRQAAKWRQAAATVDWILSSIPKDSKFQVYVFDVTARPLIEGTKGEWLDVADDKRVGEARRRLREVTPGGGTSLYQALAVPMRLRPPPDNVFLLVDGLPTQGERSSAQDTVSGDRRLDYFDQAVGQLPRQVEVNVILYPMEGDPEGAAAYWKLAFDSGGVMMSPSEDWP